jgi:DNA helicase II / ATP-dependent DNA helicase PcrA
LARIINVPKRGIGDQTIKALLEEAERNSMSLWKLILRHCRGDRTARTTIRKQTEQKLSAELVRLIEGLRKQMRSADWKPMDLVLIIEKLLSATQFEQFLEDSYGAQYESRWSNVREFVNLAAEFAKDQNQLDGDPLPLIDGVQQIPDEDVLARFLANVSLASDKQTDDSDGAGKPHITVSTIHAAKGLEWPVVFVPAVYKGSIPHARSDDEAEERRLLYVAMTRAKVLLYLSAPLHATNVGREGGVQLSPFIQDISSSFRRQGPSFDTQVITQVAKILRREAPSQAAIFKSMPQMQAVEDNLFPVDPEQGTVDTQNQGHNARPASYRRPKLPHKHADDHTEPGSVNGWASARATTMETSHSFTVPGASHAGFITAGAHHANIGTAAVEDAAKQIPKTAIKKSVGSRPSAQRSLLGYGYGITTQMVPGAVHTSQAASSGSGRQNQHTTAFIERRAHYSSRVQSTATSASQSLAGFETGLADHKLSSARLPRPPTSCRQENEPSRRYACFSSPNKPPPEEPQPNCADEKENISPQLEQRARPASSFHTTTVRKPVGWTGAGIKRPAPLTNPSGNGLTPMDRLKKPYKLTVKRT